MIAGPTGLEVTSNSQGVVADLVDAEGHVLAANQSAFDLSTTVAGTYFLRVHNPRQATQTEPIPLVIEFDAPAVGQSHPSTDRDVIRGGEGADRIVGGGGVDELFGDSGSDVFRGLSNEVRDLQPGESDAIVTPSSADVNDEPIDVEVLKPGEVDPVLRAAVARALGYPITIGYDGQPFTDATLYAHEVGSLTRLDLSGLAIDDFTGLELLSNLAVLNLGHAPQVAAFWDFDGDANGQGTEASNGQIVGATFSSEVPPQLGTGSSLHFNGTSDYVNLGNTLDPGADSYTVSLWFNAESLDGVQFLASKGNPTSSVVGWSAFLSGSQLIVRGQQVGGGADDRFDRAYPVVTTGWHHLALVIDRESNTIEGYLDGVSDGFTSGLTGDTLIPGSVITTETPLLVGIRSDLSAGTAFGGFLDNLSIYRQALNPEQIAALAAGGSPFATQVTLADIPNSLTELQYLSLASSGLTQITAADVAAFPQLTDLELSDNKLRNLTDLASMPVVDAGEPGYSEMPGPWQENLSPVDNAFDEDYRFRHVDGGEGVLAEWHFDDLLPGTYEVQVTWPATSGGSSAVSYSIEGGSSITVSQALEPNGAQSAGRPWQTLGTFTATAGQVILRCKSRAAQPASWPPTPCGWSRLLPRD